MCAPSRADENSNWPLSSPARADRLQRHPLRHLPAPAGRRSAVRHVRRPWPHYVARSLRLEQLLSRLLRNWKMAIPTLGLEWRGSPPSEHKRRCPAASSAPPLQPARRPPGLWRLIADTTTANSSPAVARQRIVVRHTGAPSGRSATACGRRSHPSSWPRVSLMCLVSDQHQRRTGGGARSASACCGRSSSRRRLGDPSGGSWSQVALSCSACRRWLQSPPWSRCRSASFRTARPCRCSPDLVITFRRPWQWRHSQHRDAALPRGEAPASSPDLLALGSGDRAFSAIRSGASSGAHNRQICMAVVAEHDGVAAGSRRRHVIQNARRALLAPLSAISVTRSLISCTTASWWPGRPAAAGAKPTARPQTVPAIPYGGNLLPCSRAPPRAGAASAPDHHRILGHGDVLKRSRCSSCSV